jgi:hypothetical protein
MKETGNAIRNRVPVKCEDSRVKYEADRFLNETARTIDKASGLLYYKIEEK